MANARKTVAAPAAAPAAAPSNGPRRAPAPAPVAAPAAPPAPPSAPRRGRPPVVPAVTATAVTAPPAARVAPPRAPAPAPAPAAPPAPAVDVAALRAEITALKEQITALAKAAKGASAKPNTRTWEEITSFDVSTLADGDWRADYHGTVLDIAHFTRHSKTGAIEPKGSRCVAHLAVPTDDDIGGNGTAARASGDIALYWQIKQDGTYLGEPSYVSLDELNMIRV